MYYLLGSLFGAIIGTMLIGGGLSWCLQKALPTAPRRVLDGLAMLTIAVGAAFMNKDVGGVHPAIVYGLAAVICWFALGKMRGTNVVLSTREEPQMERDISAVLRETIPVQYPEKRFDWPRFWKRLIGGILFTIFAALGASLVFSAIKNVTYPTSYSSFSEIYFLIGSTFLIIAFFVWRGLLR